MIGNKNTSQKSPDKASPNKTPPEIFDRQRYRTRRARAAKSFQDANFLHKRAMADIIERLESVNRNFDLALFHGAAGALSAWDENEPWENAPADAPQGGAASPVLLTPATGVQKIIHSDLSEQRLSVAGAFTGPIKGHSAKRHSARGDGTRGYGASFVCDDEHPPIADGSLDLIISLLTLHTTNDLIGALAQYRAALKPDGLFIAAIFGEETLRSLREALYAAETQIMGGVAARIAPFATMQELGALMQRAGFAMPVADLDSVRVTYQNPMQLLADLRAMGETAVLKRKSPALSRAVLKAALEYFTQTYGETRFDIVYLTGWAPAPSQPQPLKPGQGQASLADAVKALGGR